METWVLVLIIGLQSSRGVALATVPGYESFIHCVEAGRVYAADKDGENRWSRFQCIPGPRNI